MEKRWRPPCEARFQNYGEQIQPNRPAALFWKGSLEQHSGEGRGTGTPWLNGLNILLPSEEKVKILHFCAILVTFYTGIETSFREIKYCIDMICFHARKTNSIMQEIYAAVIMYNFCERLTLSVVISIGKRKHGYQANFSMGIHICMDFFRDGIPINPELEIEKYILPIRPDRTDKRKAVHAKSAITFNYRFV